MNNNLIDNLLEKSQEAFLVSIELFNKPTINYRAEGFTYFIWYGILRLCLEPLREQIYSFQLTYVLSALFIVFGIISILLNHLYFAKHRDLKFFLFVKEKIRIFYLSNYYKAKIKILFKKAKQDKKQYQSKLNWYENKLKNLIDYKNKELKNIIYRKDHEVLYYNLK